MEAASIKIQATFRGNQERAKLKEEPKQVGIARIPPFDIHLMHAGRIRPLYQSATFERF